jgi:hypothetical protein
MKLESWYQMKLAPKEVERWYHMELESWYQMKVEPWYWNRWSLGIGIYWVLK